MCPDLAPVCWFLPVGLLWAEPTGVPAPCPAVGSVLTSMGLAARTLGACLLVLVACVSLV